MALDVTDEVVEEAIRIGANLIIAHHAIMFRPVKSLSTDTPMGKLYEKLIKNDIAVYIAHTNLDVAEGGINDWMAEALGIESKESLEDVHTDQLYKLAVFVPRTHHEQVLQAILEAGAGSIGQYSKCSFNTEGTGTFVPGEGTQPFIGAQGQMERVEEMRIETLVPQSLRSKVIQAMLKAHPYEEVAYDLYAVDLKGRTLGLGRLGPLKEPKTLGELVEVVKAQFNVPQVRVVGDLNKKSKKRPCSAGQAAGMCLQPVSKERMSL